MTVFAEKLNRLAETIDLVAARGAADLGAAMALGRGRLAVAIGSGGSAVAAEYFARCRSTLGLGPTLVMTPLQFVLSMEEWSGVDIWLFSAGANNPDVAAAFKSAAGSRCEAVRLVSVRSDGETALAATASACSSLFVLPVADPKDGFLATHSMVAMVVGMLLASDGITESPSGAELLSVLQARARAAAEVEAEDRVGGFRRGDTLIALHDPQLAPVAVLLETSLWETGIAPIQRTDFRNFAHGRHVWAARHPDAMFLLSLVTAESRPVWLPIDAAIPAAVRRETVEMGHGGRLDNAVGILRGLAMISRLGRVADIDPGRPGRGAFAEAIYDDNSLLELAIGLTPSVRHKAVARQLHDPLETTGVSLCVIGRQRLQDLGEASFVGVVLDYDGTVVPNQPTAARLGPPSAEVMSEIVRLVDSGVNVGFATGRGGSAGERLRDALPVRIHKSIWMGYYNGAHLRTLDIDIRSDRPDVDDGVAAVAVWIEGSGLLRDGVRLSVGEVQVTINHADVVDVAAFAGRLSSCPEVSACKVRVLSSHHSFDVVPSGTSKLAVVRKIAGDAEAGFVIGVGDSGSPLGNDRELLSGRHGISVGSVCGESAGCWTLFGSRLEGPEALNRVLRSARMGYGGLRIDVSGLELDETD